MKNLMLDSPGKRILVLGDEAIVRGGLEAGVNFVTTYPGAPASEVADAFRDIAKEMPDIYFEYSMNEAVAANVAFGGAWGGANAAVCFKMLGLNVAADVLQCANYAGTKPGSLVVIHAGDPGLISSTNEADNRDMARHMGMPIFEPSGIQEAKDFTRYAVQMSNKWDLAVLLNFNTRLAHSMGDIELGPLVSGGSPIGKFKKDKTRLVQGQALGLENHNRLLKRIKKARKWAVKDPFKMNKIIPGGENAKVGVVTGGMSYGYVLEALDILSLQDVPVLRLGVQNPVPDDTIKNFCNDLEKVIVVEEMEPYLENEIKRIAFDEGMRFEIYGKKIYKGPFKAVGEFSPDDVVKGINTVIDTAVPKIDISLIEKKSKSLSSRIAQRLAAYCAGCPHRSTVYALKKVLQEEGLENKAAIGDDIGCYALAVIPPLAMGDWLICMSSGMGIGQGLAHRINTDDQPVFAFMGDSTFFHSGMPTLLNAVYSQANITLIIMDNRWTALTGHQPLPHTGVNSMGEYVENPISIPKICRAFGVKYVKQIDSYENKALQRIFRDCLRIKGPKVVISSRECNIQVERRRQRAIRNGYIEPEVNHYQIIPERCLKCDECLKVFGCVAIRVEKDEKGEDYYYIEDAKCTQCGVCAQVCPNGAIIKTVVMKF
ncbi:MAG: thiamine pyrophosphate-dependent enzyme [Candidatus Helarchaeota archaeon]